MRQGEHDLEQRGGALGSRGLPGRCTGVEGAGKGTGGHGLGKEASATVAGSRERGVGWQGSLRGLGSWPREGPHPGLDVLGPAGVGQGVPGLLKGAAGRTDVGDHHRAAVPTQGILDGGEGGLRSGRDPLPGTLLLSGCARSLGHTHSRTYSLPRAGLKHRMDSPGAR